MSTGDVGRRRGLQQPAPCSRRGSSPRRIGYTRVSTKAQELERQIRALKAERCDEIFKDTASGKSLAGRPQLRKALDSLENRCGRVLMNFAQKSASPTCRSRASHSAPRSSLRRSADSSAYLWSERLDGESIHQSLTPLVRA
jgi:hypothetical protein